MTITVTVKGNNFGTVDERNLSKCKLSKSSVISFRYERLIPFKAFYHFSLIGFGFIERNLIVRIVD